MKCPQCDVELWGSSDACKAFGVSRKTWAQWVKREGFPPPVGQLGGRQVWNAGLVRAFVGDR